MGSLARISECVCGFQIERAQSPIKYGEAVLPPIFIGSGDDLNVGGVRGQKIAQLADKFGAIVQAAIPGEDGAGRRDVRLRFAARFLRGMKAAVQHADVSLGIGAATVWAIRSKKWADLFEIVPVDRFAIEIPSSKLDAHS